MSGFSHPLGSVGDDFDRAEDFDDASASELDSKEATGGASDTAVEEGLAKAHLKRAEQDNTHRGWFVKWVLWVVSGTLAAGVAVMVAYVCSEWHTIESAVLIAWFSASVVQTIGLAYVIANYLFPHTEKATAKP